MKVFNKEQFIRHEMSVHGYDLEKLRNEWCDECEGLTKNQMALIGYLCDDGWLIDKEPELSKVSFEELGKAYFEAVKNGFILSKLPDGVSIVIPSTIEIKSVEDLLVWEKFKRT